MRIPVVDLFAGPGGLSEGFAVCGSSAGSEDGFDVVLSYERDPNAVRTLRFREVYRLCRSRGLLGSYWKAIANWNPASPDPDELFSISLQHIHDEAAARAREVTLGPDVRDSVAREARLAVGRGPWVLVGGPPCQAYSIVGRARNKGNPDYDPARDERQRLYEEYLHLLGAGSPDVFVLENVKGLLSATLENRWIFGRILTDLTDPCSALGWDRNESGERPKYRLFSLIDGSELVPPLPAQYELLDPGATRVFSANLAPSVVRMERFGVPQARHRVILLGIRVDLVGRGAVKPRRLQEAPEARLVDVVSDLPALRSRISDTEDGAAQWRALMRSMPFRLWTGELAAASDGNRHAESMKSLAGKVRSSAVPRADHGGPYVIDAKGLRRTRAWLAPEASNAVLKEWARWAAWYRADLPRDFGYPNHESRSHMEQDLRRYVFAASYAWLSGGRSPKIGDFPVSLHPEHRNVRRAIRDGHFSDRFRTQSAFRPATTITSHIHKDGHYYIHFDPTQARSLTVREAARAQTFPDSYVFLGPRTEQFKQVGNAVPPYLAARIADIVLEVLRQAHRVP